MIEKPSSTSETPISELIYLDACDGPADPTIVWGTDFPLEGLRAFLHELNARSDILISPAHVLIKAVGQAIKAHPEFNRRVMRRKIHAFRDINVYVPLGGGTDALDSCVLRNVDAQSLVALARELWQRNLSVAAGDPQRHRDSRMLRALPGPLRTALFRLLLRLTNTVDLPAWVWGERLRDAAVHVNYMGHRDTPPMRCYKPSRLPLDTQLLSITMGPAETGAGGVAVAPLFIRADHRVADAYRLGKFIQTLRALLISPQRLECSDF